MLDCSGDFDVNDDADDGLLIVELLIMLMVMMMFLPMGSDGYDNAFADDADGYDDVFADDADVVTKN